jgi:FkbM family methyltransferase
MFLIKERSYHTENPIYQKISNENGFMFVPEARVAKDYFNTGFYERNYIDWVISNNFIKADKNVIDIGAHIGFYTIAFAEKAKHVYSFECSPKSFNYLCGNIALNNKDYKVTKYNCALTNETQKDKNVNYYIRDPNDGGGNGISKFLYDEVKNTPFIEVPAKTLDSFNLTNVNFIKIDVEGHEKEVLQGAVKTIIENDYPKIFFESWDKEKEDDLLPADKLRNELFEFINSLEYKIIKIGHDMFIAER